MNFITWIFLIVIIALMLRMFLPVKGVSNITSQEAKEKFKQKDVQFVDVRTPGEYKAGHQKKFTNIPLSNLAGRMSELDKTKEVVLICQSGMRSMRAARMLKKKGFEKVINVKGGMSAWV